MNAAVAIWKFEVNLTKPIPSQQNFKLAMVVGCTYISSAMYLLPKAIFLLHLAIILRIWNEKSTLCSICERIFKNLMYMLEEENNKKALAN